MLVATVFSLNLVFASHVQLAAAPANVLATSALPTATTSNSLPARTDEPPTQKKTVDEDIHIIGDPLLKKLKGNLRGAFEAFEKGEFAKAERQFGTLARKEFVRAQRRHWNELELANALNLPLDRSTTFTPDKWDALSETKESASLAISRSKFDLYSTARLDAAASKLFFLEGLAQERQGKTEKALKSYKKALTLHKNNVDARIEYALLSLRQNDMDTSGKQLEKLEKIFNRKCRNNRCLYAPESKTRYSQVKMAYAQMVEAK